MKINKQTEQRMKDKISNFQYLRQNRVSFYQGIFISLLVAITIIALDLLAGEDPIIKLFILIVLIVLVRMYYLSMLIQTQKPVIVCENLSGTLENEKIVTDTPGKKWLVASVSNTCFQEPGEK